MADALPVQALNGPVVESIDGELFHPADARTLSTRNKWLAAAGRIRRAPMGTPHPPLLFVSARLACTVLRRLGLAALVLGRECLVVLAQFLARPGRSAAAE